MNVVRLFLATAALTLTGVASAANLVVNERYVNDWSLGVGGSFILENPFGNIEVIGVDGPGVHAVVNKIMTGVDKAAIADARNLTQLKVDGDERVRILRTVLPAFRNGRWSSNVTYQVRIPRTAHVKISSNSSDRIRIYNITGNVFVKNVNGTILLQNVLGATNAQSANGTIVFDANGRPGANAELSTVNGDVQVYVAPDSAFQWLADTIRGDFRTNLPVRGRFTGTGFRGSVNSLSGPTISTTSLMGNVFLLSRGTPPSHARTVRNMVQADVPHAIIASRTVRMPSVEGHYTYVMDIGSFFIDQILGDADITTGAGEVHLGVVRGECNVTSKGGPLQLGDIFGPLVARTGAGDIVVNAARQGGILNTGGGIIRVLYTGGPTTLTSDGGDIVVRQASGAISAETKSGDIAITVDPAKSERVSAKTGKGNVLLSLSPRISADIDATVITSDADADTIRTDFVGLTVRREQVGAGKIRIRATGKLNGGGERIELQAEDGGIQILANSGSPLVASPQ